MVVTFEEPQAVFARLREWRTALVPYNDLIDVAERFVEGSAQSEQIGEAMVTADLALGALRQEFQEGLRFQEASPILDRLAPLVWGLFASLQETFGRLEAALQENQLDSLLLGLQEGNAAINQVFAALSELSDGLDTLAYSESPYVNELLRVGYACLAGTLSVEIFQERFLTYWNYHCAFVAQFSSWQPSPAEQTVWEEELPEIEDAIEQQTEGLEEMLAFFESGEEARLDAALFLVQLATAAFLKSHKRIQEASSLALYKACVQCGQDNPLESRFCVGCGARLPEGDPGLLPAARNLTLAGDESASPLGSNLETVLESAEKLRREESSLDEFAATVQWFVAIIDKVALQFKALPESTSATVSEEQWLLYSQMRSSLETGLQRLQKGSVQLRRFLEVEDYDLLEEALGNLEQGARTLEVQL